MRIVHWIMKGELPYAWVGWALLAALCAVDTVVDAAALGIALLITLHEFAALRRRSALLSTRISLMRWFRRVDDEYFNAVQQAVDDLDPRQRERFALALGCARRSRDVERASAHFEEDAVTEVERSTEDES